MRDRKKRRGHIRAAKEWLGAAEHSLDSENDVQSDLKVMLAKAELSQVQESERTSRLMTWGKRMAPVLVAVLLSAGLVSLVQVQHASVERAEHSSTTQAADAVQPLPAPAEAAAKATGDTAPVSPARPASAAGRDEPVYQAQPVAQESAQPRTETREAPAPTQPLRKATVPDAEKQQLMQKAGQILRQ